MTYSIVRNIDPPSELQLVSSDGKTLGRVSSDSVLFETNWQNGSLLILGGGTWTTDTFEIVIVADGRIVQQSFRDLALEWDHPFQALLTGDRRIRASFVI